MIMRINSLARSLCLLLLLAMISGCATVHSPDAKVDPLEPFNRGVYAFNADLDATLMKPTAQAYQAHIPRPVRRSISNFFSNLDDVVVLVNDLLQFKGAHAVNDTLRLSMNSTFGLFGLLDVATPAGLPKHDADFGQTLGKWGLGPGPYLVLPVLGPSDVRDATGLAVDVTYVNPVEKVKNTPARAALIVTQAVNTRARLLKVTNVLEQAALDPYVFTRAAYLQRRRSLIYDGNPPPLKFDNFNDDFQLPPTKPLGLKPSASSGLAPSAPVGTRPRLK